jgi:hypothetical protein
VERLSEDDNTPCRLMARTVKQEEGLEVSPWVI